MGHKDYTHACGRKVSDRDVSAREASETFLTPKIIFFWRGCGGEPPKFTARMGARKPPNFSAGWEERGANVPYNYTSNNALLQVGHPTHAFSPENEASKVHAQKVMFEFI